jgi:hypothetical protein
VKVFISQSRDRSRAVAFELQQFVRLLVPGTEPWVSNTGIEKGSRWSPELAENLDDAGAGIICLDADNLDDRWILFEAGTLARKPQDKVWTFLLDIDYSQVQQPLSQFQHTKAERSDVLLMIQSISNTAAKAGTPQRTDADVRVVFDALWPQVEARLAQIKATPAANPKPIRTTDEMLTEVLDTVRGLSKQAEASAWVPEKSLKMLHMIYRAVLGDKAPPLAELRKIVASWDEGSPLPAVDTASGRWSFNGRQYSGPPQFTEEPTTVKPLREFVEMRSAAASTLGFASGPPPPLVAEADKAKE